MKCLHLLHNQRFLKNLLNLIGSRKEHRIVLFNKEYNEYREANGESISIKEIRCLIEDYDVLFVHFMNYQKAHFINSLNKKVKIVWFFWGGDGFYLGKFVNEFLLPKTRKLRLKLGIKHFFTGGWKSLMRILLGPLLDYIYPNKEVLNAIYKVDVIVPIVPQDYDLLTSKYKIHAKMFHVNYVNSLFFSPLEYRFENKGNNILLGNSARYSNNHVEVIDRLSNSDLEDRKIVIPLSYGDKNYGRYIREYARKHLNNREKVLEDLLPMNKYLEIFTTCDTIIMNQCRQQALGNVVLALWFEKTIYMNPHSELYMYLMEKNFIIWKVNSFKVGRVFSKEETKHNRRRLHKIFGPERQRKRFGKLLNVVRKMMPNEKI